MRAGQLLRVAAALAVLLAVVGFGACGGGDDKDGGASPVIDTRASSPTPSPSPAASATTAPPPTQTASPTAAKGPARIMLAILVAPNFAGLCESQPRTAT